MLYKTTKKGWQVGNTKMFITSRQMAENAIETKKILNSIK